MYKYDKNFFEQINTEEKAYWAGFIAADGNIRKDFHKVRIELARKDRDHLFKFRKAIDGNNPIKDYTRFNNYSTYIEVNCKKMCEDLNKIGITPNKSLTLNIDLTQIPKDLTHHFIRGYFDGDGSLNSYQRKNTNYLDWELSFISTKIFLNKILKELELNKALFYCGNNYRFCLKSKKDIYKCLIYLYKDAHIYLDRKYDKMLKFLALNDYQVATLIG